MSKLPLHAFLAAVASLFMAVGASADSLRSDLSTPLKTQNLFVAYADDPVVATLRWRHDIDTALAFDLDRATSDEARRVLTALQMENGNAARALIPDSGLKTPSDLDQFVTAVMRLQRNLATITPFQQ